jgi:hypothetical protein
MYVSVRLAAEQIVVEFGYVNLLEGVVGIIDEGCFRAGSDAALEQ